MRVRMQRLWDGTLKTRQEDHDARTQDGDNTDPKKQLTGKDTIALLRQEIAGMKTGKGPGQQQGDAVQAEPPNAEEVVTQGVGAM